MKIVVRPLELIQIQALRICCGAVCSAPRLALQVEMGEKPLDSWLCTIGRIFRGMAQIVTLLCSFYLPPGKVRRVGGLVALHGKFKIW